MAEGEDFGQEKPPLLVTVKRLLEKYPDGQIFKEIIQNADDAKAEEVKFVLDHRQVPTISSDMNVSRSAESQLSKFCGPALLAFNNALFSEKDWKSIQKPQQSEKAENPFKVGKFGIGFNSVYHITDLPMLISGKFCAFFDPQEHIWKSRSGGPSPGKKFTLTELHRNSDVLDSFNGICGFTNGVKNFEGTLFRFPLRKVASELSKKCYNVEQVEALGAVLRDEANYILLFLRSVKKISLCHLHGKNQLREVFEVTQTNMIKHEVTVCEAPNSILQCAPDKRCFAKRVCEIFKGADSKYMYSTPKVVTGVCSVDVVVTDQTGEYKHHWLLVQQVGSSVLHVRDEAEEQCILPWVGTAIETMSCAPYCSGGRLFCFLPMPCEATAPIPVAVNGTFALYDNRRSLKWPAAERKGDPEAEWNKLLIERCLPSCYVRLLLKFIEINEDKGTSDEVYRAWPNAKKVHSLGEDDPQKDWSGFLKPFFTELFTHKVVFAESCTGSCWVSTEDVDVIFNDNDGGVPLVVVNVLLQSGLKVAKLVPGLQSAIKVIDMDITIITPKEVRYILKDNLNAYQDCSSASKLELLNYCLKDGDFAGLVGLELLPLHNGEYIRFTENSQDVDQLCYLCRDHFLEILCDCHHLLVNSRAINLEQLAERRCTQLQMLEDADVARLLRQHMPEDGYNDNWLQKFWSWITLRLRLLHLFEDLPLLPVRRGRVALLKKSAGVVFGPLNNEVKSHLSTALHKYKVQMVDFRYLQLSSALMSYVHQFDGPGVLDAISYTCSEACESIELTAEEASTLQVFLDDSHRNIRGKRAVGILCRLAIFHVLQHPQGHLVSINSVVHSNQTKNEAIAEKDDFDLSQDFLPHTPLVLSRAHNQPSLLQVMEGLLIFMTKMSFLCEVLLPMINKKSYSESKLEGFMMELLKEFESLTERYPTQKTTFVDILKELRFLKNTKREWKSPKEMYNPKHPLICSLFKGQDVFPVAPFNSQESVLSLKQCGLRGLESVTAQCIVNIIEEIGKITQSHEPVKCDSICYERAHAVVRFLNDHQNILNHTVRITEMGESQVYYLTGALEILTGKYCWLPVCSHRPSNYPSWLSWKGNQYSQHLASSRTPIMALDKDCEHSDMCMIMGSEMLFLESCPSSLAKVFSSSKLSFVNATTAHLETVIYKATSDSLSSIYPAAYNFLDSVCKNYYRKPRPSYSQSSFVKLSASSSSSSSPWYTSTSFSAAELKEDAAIVDKISCYRDKLFLLIGKKFVKPSRVAKHGGFTGPYLYSLPDNLVMLKYLKAALGIKDEFDSLELVDALNRMYQDYGSRRLPKECCNVVNKIMNMLSDCDLEGIEEIYLPDDPPDGSYRLHNAFDLCIREQWYEADHDCKYVCDRLAKNAAIKLGVKTVSSRFLQQYVSNEQPFGQREDLICRIKNILSDYPLDNESNTFLKELIQNADDAKATKMCVILDKRTHSSEHVLSENWSELQGPALLVWNDAEFSEKDLKGIKQLGLGSKHSDSESIGQFGVGFNVVYHITDCPSFITGGTTLCILDPYCRYAPRATVTAPGRRFDKLDEAFWNKFSGLKNPYLRDQSRELQGGSLFRFPLRQTASDSSEEYKDGDDNENEMESGDEDDTIPSVDADELEGLLNIWVPQVKESLLFLNHVTHFSFYVILEEHGIELRHQYEVQIDEGDLLKRKAFYDDSKLFCQNMIPQLITYHLLITSGRGTSKSTEEWLVQQGVGDISGNGKEWSFLKHISPRHGLAVPLSPCKAHTFRGKAFCFLPLPINTNLPIHVNGHFVLSKSRRSLWSSNEQDRIKIWNDNLIEAISSSYAHFVVVARQCYVQTTVKRSQDLATALSRYYQLFPYLEGPLEFSLQLGTKIGRIVLKAKKSSGSNPENVWKSLCEQTFKKLWTNNAEVLAFCERDMHGAISGMVKWHELHNSEDPYNQAYFAHSTLDDSVEQLLVKLGMVVTCAPMDLRKLFKDLGYNPMACSSREAYGFYITFHEKILQRHCPVPIADTPFQTPSQFVKFTLYVTELDISSKFRQYYNSPFGHPLLLTADNYIRVFDEDNKVIYCAHDFSDFFLDSLCRFLHPSMAKLDEQLSPKYFSNKEPLSKVIDILSRNLPPSLFDVQRVDNSNGEVILWDKLQLLWMCLYYTPVFNQHKQAIVEQFAIIPTFIQHLYSTKSSVLPLVLSEPYMQGDQSTCRAAYHVLKNLGLPVIDTSKATLLTDSQSEVLDIIKQYCAKMSEPAKVLKTLYYFHIQTGVLTHILKKEQVSKSIQTLFKYFQGILFHANRDSKEHLESLPLFKTVSGIYTSVWKKDTFIWPDGCCMAGYDKWAVTEDILLKGKEEWEALNHYLNIHHLSQKDVYMKFILKAFEKLDETERKEHLLYIKDLLFDTIVPADQVKFLNQMKTIPCLEDPDGNGLLPVSHFPDPDVEIFQMFAEQFKFPRDYYRSEEWLTFFKKIGLKTTLETNEFVSLCELVASGDHTSTEQASNCLKQYLFSYETCTWLADTSLLERIGNICFVRPNPLRELNWIKPPCSPVNRHLNLTTLKGAAVSSCAKLVWTLMPVVSVPSVAKIPNSLSFKKKLGMVIKPSARDIYTNILSISQTGLADFKLFETYRKEFICRKESKKTSIVAIMCECLEALYQHGGTGYDLLKDLVNVPCIPVSADSMDNFVLVNSFQVVLSMSQSEVPLKPYINELPTPMHGIFPKVLSRIGVTSQVEVKHLEYMLETIHNQIGAGKIQINQLPKLRTAVLKLAQICADSLSQRNSLTCLYLPCHERTLVKSTTLLVDDSKRYEDIFHLDFTSTSYRIFALPPHSSYDTSTMNMSENDAHVCQSLPEKLRPKPLTVFIDERIVEGAKAVENTDLCDQVVEMARFHQHIQLGLLRYLEADHSDMKVQVNSFSTEIGRILTSLEVKVIMNLEARLFLTLDNPPSFLGTRKVQFILDKNTTGSFLLYLDSMVASFGLRKYWRELSQSMCIQAARNSNSDPATFLTFSKSLSEFLQIRNLDDLKELTYDFSVSYDDMDTPFSLPQLGAKVSISDCHQDINNIFRAQEWVAYEVSEGQFIFAIVLHPILPSRGEMNAGLIQRKYLIRFGKKEEKVLEVSALDLYKLIDPDEDVTHTTELDAARHVTELCIARHTERRVARHPRSVASSSTFATRKKLTDKQKLKELKKKICQDLREVWTLPEKDRKKALKRLYLHYHPDKAKPEEVDVYEEAFKFLQRQIQKLDSGQNMDDPEASSTLSDTRQSSWSKYYQSWSETAQNMHREQRQRKQERGKGFSGYQPTPNSVEANRWLRQAKADCCSMMVLKHSVRTTPDTASMLCFVAHQVVEKALKAGMYLLFGLDPACLLHHQLSCHAAAIYSERPSDGTRDLYATSAALEKHYIQARYPNAHDLPTAPVDIYTIQEAEQLADLAKQALEIIQKLMM